MTIWNSLQLIKFEYLNQVKTLFNLRAMGTGLAIIVLLNFNNGAYANSINNSASATNKILVVGDSLSAEYGLKKGEGWVNLLDKKLSEKKIPTDIQNASISGETTSGGKARIDRLLTQYNPSLVIIELGANDGLRGLPLKAMQDNLDYMVLRSVAKGARVLVVGMKIPPNFGSTYAKDFSNTFLTVAKNHNVGVVDFFLKNVADINNGDSLNLFQSDRVHPNSLAQPIMMNNVYVKLEPMLFNK